MSFSQPFFMEFRSSSLLLGMKLLLENDRKSVKLSHASMAEHIGSRAHETRETRGSHWGWLVEFFSTWFSTFYFAERAQYFLEGWWMLITDYTSCAMITFGLGKKSAGKMCGKSRKKRDSKHNGSTLDGAITDIRWWRYCVNYLSAADNIKLSSTRQHVESHTPQPTPQSHIDMRIEQDCCKLMRYTIWRHVNLFLQDAAHPLVYEF